MINLMKIMTRNIHSEQVRLIHDLERSEMVSYYRTRQVYT